MLNIFQYDQKSRYLPLVKKIEDFACKFESLTPEAVKEKTNEFKSLLANGKRTPASILPEAFALVKASCKSMLDIELTRENLISGILINKGCAVEIIEELDKHMGIILASYLYSLSGNPVHVALANEFFAGRDCQIAGTIYSNLGLKVGLGLSSTDSYDLKREVYSSDVVYSTANQLAVDYLISENESENKKFFAKDFGFLIVDSADEVLIDYSEVSFVLPETPDSPSKSMKLYDFIRLYKKLSGISPAAESEAKAFKTLYALGVEKIRQSKHAHRIDFPNAFCKTEVVKYRQVVKEIQDVQQKKRPVIVGIANAEDAKLLSIMLSKQKIEHYILSESDAEARAYTLALSGKKNVVTIISGESFLDAKIILGGVPSLIAESILTKKGLNRSSRVWDFEYRKIFQEQKTIAEKERQELVQNGGLHVIGTTLYSTGRLDAKFRQLANSSGTPGSSKFFISLEDEFLKSIGMERLIDLINKFTTKKDVLVVSKFWSKFVTGSIDVARNDFLRENPSPVAYLIKKHEKGYVFAKNTPHTANKIGRNALCPCGSGKKYKKCCGA